MLPANCARVELQQGKGTLMADTVKQPMGTQDAAETQRYYKLQMRAWTNFDASRMDLGEIADRIERGSGFLTAIEVIKVAEDVSGIDDAEVRQSFENIVAAERTLRNLGELPKGLRDKLYAALTSQADQSKQPRAA
jgi:hypothetical protein